MRSRTRKASTLPSWRTDPAATLPVSYTGTVPDPFREGREVIVTVRKQGDGFVGQRDSLITKCPSKFSTSTPKST